MALIRNTANGSFQLYHSLSSGISLDDNNQEEQVINTLPGCVNYQEGQGYRSNNYLTSILCCMTVRSCL